MQPVRTDGKTVSINPDAMETEKMYHCFFGEKLMLFFKDSGGFLSCYEVEDPDIVSEARSTGNIDAVLERAATNR